MFVYRMMALCVLVLILVIKFVWTEVGPVYVIAAGAVGLILFVMPEIHMRMAAGSRRHFDEAERYLELGDLRTAETEFMEAIHQSKSAADRAFVFMRLSEPQRRQRKFEAADESIQRAMELLVSAKKGDGPQYAACIEQLATVRRDQGNFPEALKLFRESLERVEKLPKADATQIAKRYLELGISLYQAGDLASSVQILDKAKDQCSAVFGPGGPETGTAMATMGAALERMGEYVKARPLLERGMQIQKETRGHNDPQVAQSLYHLAIAYQHSGDPETATAHFEHLLELREKHVEKNPMEMGEVLCRLAEVYAETGRPAKAEELVRRAIFFFETKPDERLAAALDLLGTIYDRAGRYDDALPLYDRARTIWGNKPEGTHVAQKQAAVLRFMRRDAEADNLVRSLQMS